MKSLISFLFLFPAAGLFCLLTADPVTARPPNVILILADDMS